MKAENERKNAKEKKARFIKFIPKMIRLGVFLFAVGVIFVALVYLKPGYKSDDVRKILGIIWITIGGVFALGGGISYFTVKRSLLKDLRVDVKNGARGRGFLS